jgi:hypothetical protein
MSQAGIGTYSIPEMATPMMAKVSKTVDMMIGNHLNAHVMGQSYLYSFHIRLFISNRRI